ncbi:MAG: 2-isopropylmalate synthase, partial [Armatimonadetes bacterium]|nr:2-isopropylmalate synthase [Armatimonadota bacterium]
VRGNGDQTGAIPTAAVELARTDKHVGPVAAVGNGPIDAVYQAIDKAVRMKPRLVDYQIRSISVGKDAIGEATVRIASGGLEAWGKAASTDIIEASVQAYIDAINRLEVRRQRTRKQASG